MRQVHRIIGLLALMGLARAAHAQAAPEWDELRRRVEQLERLVEQQARQIEALRADATASASTAPDKAPDQQPAAPRRGAQADYLPSRGWAGGTLHYGGEEVPIATHGFVDLEYLDAQAQGSRGGVSTFDNHHANIFFTSNLRHDLRAHVELEFEHAGTTVETDQAYVSWHARDWLELTAGRFYTPFGIERFTWYSPTNGLVSRPEPMRQIVPGNFYANGLKLSGMLRQGGHPRLTYEVALSDGLGERALTARRDSRQDRDNNSNRALSGRAALVFWPGLELGASLHTQRYATRGEQGLRFVGFDLAARRAGFELRSEYVAARLERAGLAPLRQDGSYAQLSYTFVWDRDTLPALSVLVRRERLDLDRAARGANDTRRTAFGLNLKLFEHFRAKAEYQLNGEDGPKKRDDAFLGQLVVDF